MDQRLADPNLGMWEMIYYGIDRDKHRDIDRDVNSI